MQPAPEILAAVTRNLLAAVDGRGVERVALLERAGLDEHAIADPDVWVPIAQHVRLGRAIMAAFPRENLGLQTGNRIYGDPRGALGYVLRGSGTLSVALRSFCLYQGVVNRALRVELARDSACSALILHMGRELTSICHPAEALFAAWVGIARHLTGSKWCPENVAFSHAAQGDPAEHQAFFGCAVRFEQEHTVLRIPAQVGALPIASAAHELEAVIVAAVTAAHGFAAEAGAERALAELGATLMARPLDVASLDAGVSEAARLALARGLLASSRLFVYEVAYLLGFADLRSFEQRFAARFGVTARALRFQD